MLNTVSIQGRLIKDPILAKVGSGDTSLVKVTIAVDRDFKNKETGERSADFINVEAWRGTADFAARYLHKGDMTIATGRLQTASWTDSTSGEKKFMTKVVASSFYIIPGGGRTNGSGGGSNTFMSDAAFENGNDYMARQAQAQAGELNLSGGTFTEIPNGEDDGDVLPF